MGYIIVWRNGLKEPHVDKQVNDFKEDYSSYDKAKESAEAQMRIAEGQDRKNYIDYAIYQLVTK
jgi:hypothetical protein